MPIEARQNLFQGPLNIYLQHVFQTIIYFMKIQSQNIYFANTPVPPLEMAHKLHMELYISLTQNEL